LHEVSIELLFTERDTEKERGRENERVGGRESSRVLEKIPKMISSSKQVALRVLHTMCPSIMQTQARRRCPEIQEHTD
jgi:hypothetical protein